MKIIPFYQNAFAKTETKNFLFMLNFSALEKNFFYALIFKRLKEGKHHVFVSHNISAHAYANTNVSAKTNFTDRLLSEIKNKEFCFFTFDGSKRDVSSDFTFLDKNFTNILPDFKEETEIEREIQILTGNKIRIYKNENDKHSVVFSSWAAQDLTYFAFFDKILPWLFEETPVTELERKFLDSAKEPTANKFISVLQTIIQEYGIGILQFEEQIKNISNAPLNKKIKELRGSVERLENTITQYYNTLAQYIEEREKNAVMLSGYCQKLKETNGGSDELFNYLKHSKNIHLVQITEEKMDFIVTTTLDNFDPVMYERMIKNKNSYFYDIDINEGNPFENNENKKKFLEAVFGEDSVFKIKIKAFYSITLNKYMNPVQQYRYPQEFDDYVCNPHFYFFACPGNNREIIDKAIRNNDYIMVCENCIASAKNLNLSEGEQTVGPFLSMIFNDTEHKYVLLPDGNSVTCEEALKWLEAQEEHDNKENINKI